MRLCHRLAEGFEGRPARDLCGGGACAARGDFLNGLQPCSAEQQVA